MYTVCCFDLPHVYSTISSVHKQAFDILQIKTWVLKLPFCLMSLYLLQFLCL